MYEYVKHKDYVAAGYCPSRNERGMWCIGGKGHFPPHMGEIIKPGSDVINVITWLGDFESEYTKVEERSR